MEVFRRILGIVVISISVIFIAACLAGVFFSWSINTPMTNAITGVLTGVERVLVVADNSLTLVTSELSEAQTNIDTIEEKVGLAGETLSETSVVYEVLDRTVGDELFPKIASARDTILFIRDSILSFNDILESLNDIPLVSVPTLTEELNSAAERIAEAQSDAETFRAELHAIKEEAISKPVTAITDKTTRISDGLHAAQQNLSSTQADIREDIQVVLSFKARVPRIIDLSSTALSFLFLWIALGQVSLIVRIWNSWKAPKQLDTTETDVPAADETE